MPYDRFHPVLNMLAFDTFSGNRDKIVLQWTTAWLALAQGLILDNIIATWKFRLHYSELKEQQLDKR